jgi:two-component system phosphate regulon sensor histidine kinase PhoR
MTKKIFWSSFTVSAAVLLACLIIVFGALYEYFAYIQEEYLAEQTRLIARGVEEKGEEYFDGLETQNYRITWIAADGTVLFDTVADAATMENHTDRAEVKAAFENGEGESSRTSSTLAEKTLYHAKLLSDGTVVRVSVTQYTIMRLVMGMIQPLCIVLAVALVFSAVLASRLSKKIVKPLANLDLEQPLDNDVYDELAPMLTRIEHQHRQIEDQMRELKRRQNEFSAVTGSMNEGLVLLGDGDKVLSINDSAARLFDADPDCAGKNILAVSRNAALREVVAKARTGERAEEVTQIKGGSYMVDASPVVTDGKVTGVAILTFDITEKMNAERRRREFSANVSHELKTPLQSIMGSAELMENKLVKSEDIPRFAENIRTEATRLVALIDDIIRLSQLDEGGEMPREDVDFMQLSTEAVNALKTEAEKKNITVSVSGDEAVVFGVRQLLYEIVFNLCDNAIKYNIDGGKVSVTVTEQPDAVVLTVADTGIGIPPEHRERVFERFYRVDKSHSKQTGGTGLGLSIVKHAAACHNAEIELESEELKGTTITVRFPTEK